jgi:hypothetical protein
MKKRYFLSLSILLVFLIACQESDIGSQTAIVTPSPEIAKVEINTVDSLQLISKKAYIDATLRVKGIGGYENFEKKIQIKG